jgi:YHS domain-containing protein
MLRGLLYILIAILVLTFIRMVAGVLFKSVGAMLEPDNPAATPTGSRTSANAPSGGELKRDPVCGTFVPVANSVKRTVHGEVVHFCSSDCRDKYIPS